MLPQAQFLPPNILKATKIRNDVIPGIFKNKLVVIIRRISF